MRYLCVLLLVAVLLCPQARTENIDEFKIRSSKVFSSVDNNFSLPKQGVQLEYRKINDGSAEARKTLFGYHIALDYEELENASNFELEGMFAHELSHIESYIDMNWFDIVIYAVKYQMFPGFRKEVEVNTDRRAIAMGFGTQLKSFREYRLRTASDSDKERLQKNYLSPEEIRTLTENWIQ